MGPTITCDHTAWPGESACGNQVLLYEVAGGRHAEGDHRRLHRHLAVHRRPRLAAAPPIVTVYASSSSSSGSASARCTRRWPSAWSSPTRAPGVVNFAQGAMAMWGAFVYDELRKTGDLVFVVGRVHVTDAAPVAVALGILSSAAIGGLAHLLVFRPLRRAPALAKIVASLGLLVTLQALVTIRFGSTPRAVQAGAPDRHRRARDPGVLRRPHLPHGASSSRWRPSAWAVLRFTRHGTALRAAAEDERSAEVLGYAPQRLAAASWIVGAAIGGAVAICAAPSTTLDAAELRALRGAGAGGGAARPAVVGRPRGRRRARVRRRPVRADVPRHEVVVAVVGCGGRQRRRCRSLVVIVALFVVGKNLPTRSSAVAPDLPAAFVPRWRPRWWSSWPARW